MKVTKNPTFLKHKMQIEEALLEMAGPARMIGEGLFQQMLISAEQLDIAIMPEDGSKPTPESVSVKREEFHKHCREFGEWMTEYAPSLKLDW